MGTSKKDQDQAKDQVEPAASEQDEDPLSLDRIDRIVKIVRDTTLGSPLIEFGLMKEVDIVLDKDMKTAGYYSESFMGGPEITLNASLSDAVLAVALAHELRHVEQMMVQPRPPVSFSPDEAVRLTRICEADASAYSAGVAYEIFQATGDAQYLEALDTYEEGDIRDAFVANASPDTPVAQDAAPFQAAFDQWFNKAERVTHYDRAAIDQYEAVSESVFAKLFNEKAAGPLTTEMLVDIGCMPNRRNYLRESGAKEILLEAEQYIGNVSLATQAKADKLAAAAP